LGRHEKRGEKGKGRKGERETKITPLRSAGQTLKTALKGKKRRELARRREEGRVSRSHCLGWAGRKPSHHA